MTEKNKYKTMPSDKTLEKMCILSYDIGRKDNKIPGLVYYNNYECKSGLYADVYYNDKYLVFVFRGTEINHLNDVKTDLVMYLNQNMPQQFYEADRLWNRLQEKDMFPDKKVIATGHSLGASISVYLGNKYGDKAVAFCPYGIGDIVEARENADNITNYGNPKDLVFMNNRSNQIGIVKYVFNQNNFVQKGDVNKLANFNRFHKLENYGDIDFATEDISGKEYVSKMSQAYDMGKLSAEEKIIYESISRQILDSEYYNSGKSNSCPGYVNVHSYTRNGKEVSGYTRNCPYHGM